ncbi:MAG: histidine kinase [Planctomycetes bacterium]|nr:histidine kinase [Planctomycetota bacterium]
MRLRTQPWHEPTGGRGPGRFFVVFLATMFALEFGIMAVLPQRLPADTSPLAAAVVGAAVLTAVLAPLIWFGFVRPVQRLHESRGVLLGKFLSAQEHERRITANLHDGLGQNLTAMLVRLSVIEGSSVAAGVRENAAALREIAATSRAEIRSRTSSARRGRPHPTTSGRPRPSSSSWPTWPPRPASPRPSPSPTARVAASRRRSRPPSIAW